MPYRCPPKTSPAPARGARLALAVGVLGLVPVHAAAGVLVSAEYEAAGRADFGFRVTVVPEPAAAGLLGAGGAALLTRLRRA